MKLTSPLKIVGITEILIGGITLLVNIGALSLGTNHKPPNVLGFVLVTACISGLLGVGVLKKNKPSYVLLVYFSSVIILTKLLMFMGIIQLNGALDVSMPGPVKNMISVFYHAFVIVILLKSDARKFFQI